MKNKLIITGLIFIGIISRLLPHEANFTAVGAIAIFSGVYFPKKYAISILLITMLVSDFFLGFYPITMWVYGSFILISLLSAQLKNNLQNKRIFLFPFASAILFFVITNFGVWTSGNIYTHDIKGLIDCYVMAVPFFRGTFLGDLFYTVVLVSGFNFGNVHAAQSYIFDHAGDQSEQIHRNYRQ